MTDVTTKLNDQYQRAKPDSLAMRVAYSMRIKMFDAFIKEIRPSPEERVLDIGVSSDQTYENSNYFEQLYPYKSSITAIGLEDASFLETKYPGLTFKQANALALPFDDQSFDIVHSSAVLEHVGSTANQRKMIAESLRVARRAVMLTTPNRWFPVEFHTQLPLAHWLPQPIFRQLLNALGLHFYADENNLNLLGAQDISTALADRADWSFRFVPMRLLGWTSNLVVCAYRKNPIAVH